MMTNKLITLALIIAAFFTSCNSDDGSIIESPEAKDDSNVASVTYYFYDASRLVKTLTYPKFESIDPSSGKEYEYDAAGNLIKESFINVWNSERYILWQYEYEFSGNRKEKEIFFTCNVFPGGKLQPTRSVVYYFEGDLLVKSETCSGGGGLFYYSDYYIYDERGNLVESYSYNTGINNRRKYEYDHQDRLITELTTDGILDFYPCLKYSYDNDGRVIKTEYHEYDEGLNRYEVNVYNETTHLLEMKLSYDKNGVQTNKIQHFYDGKGNNIKTVRNDEYLVSERKYDDTLLILQIFYEDGNVYPEPVPYLKPEHVVTF